MCVPSFGACCRSRAPMLWTPSELMRRFRVPLSPKALHASSSPWDSVVQSLSQHITSNRNSLLTHPPTLALLFLANTFYKKSKQLLSTCPCKRVCVVFLGWLRCLPIHSACYCYRRCLQWQVRHTPLPEHHWQHHLTRPSGGALNTHPPPPPMQPRSRSPFILLRSNSLPSSRAEAGEREKKRPAWCISLIPLANGDGEYHGAQCSNWQIKSNEMSLQM